MTNRDDPVAALAALKDSNGPKFSRPSDGADHQLPVQETAREPEPNLDPYRSQQYKPEPAGKSLSTVKGGIPRKFSGI